MSGSRPLPELLDRAGLRTVSIVIPAFDEAENLPVVLDACLELGTVLGEALEVVVVDDHSADATGEIADKYAASDPRVRVVRNERNRGCHPSELIGFGEARGDAFFFIPADRQIMPDQIVPCLEGLASADYVCTNRVPRADPPHRRWISRGYNWTVRRALKVDLHDVDSSVMLRRAVFDRIGPEIDATTAFVSVQLVFHAVRAGFRVAEVEIEHHPRVAGRARGINLRDVLKVPLELGRFWWFVLGLRLRERRGVRA